MQEAFRTLIARPCFAPCHSPVVCIPASLFCTVCVRTMGLQKHAVHTTQKVRVSQHKTKPMCKWCYRVLYVDGLAKCAAKNKCRVLYAQFLGAVKCCWLHAIFFTVVNCFVSHATQSASSFSTVCPLCPTHDSSRRSCVTHPHPVAHARPFNSHDRPVLGATTLEFEG